MLMWLLSGPIVQLRKPTGSGKSAGDTDPDETYTYAQSVFRKYMQQLEVTDPTPFLKGKAVLEIGPGDNLAVAFLFLAHGARQVVCMDRFRLVQDRTKNARLARIVLNSLPEHNREYLQQAVACAGDKEIRLDSYRLQYLCSALETIPLPDASVDLVVSNAVLEHVCNIDKLFQELNRVMKPGSVMVHALDLGPHQLYMETPLDFLTIPEWCWKLMTSCRGAPNRARKSQYEQMVVSNRFKIMTMQITDSFSRREIEGLRTRAPGLCRTLNPEDLSCRGILFAAKKNDT